MAKAPKKIVQKKAEETPAKKKVEEEEKIDAGTDSADTDTSDEEVDEEEEVPERISQKDDTDEDDGAPTDPVASKSSTGDYLRQYQYRREIPLGDPATDPQPGGKAAAMKAFLLSQEKVTILIPLDDGSDPKVPYSVTLNGYRLDLPTNTYVEVPKQVAEVIMQSQKQTVAALDKGKIGGGKMPDALV